MGILIFANGEMPVDGDWLIPYFDKAHLIVAVDGGLRHILAHEQLPDLIIGDLDSWEANSLPTQANATILSHPRNKDETDLELALLHVCRQFHWRHHPIYVFAAFGGRLDQMMGNILLLTHPRLLPRDIYLVENKQCMWLVYGTTTIQGKIGDTVSLVPLRGDVYIAETIGLQWPLQDELLYFGATRGISNVLTAETASVSVRSGLLLCIYIQQ